MPVLGLSAWAGALVAHRVAAPWALAAGAVVLVVAAAVLRRRGRQALATVAAVVLVGAAVAGATWLRAEAVHASPVAGLAAERAVVGVTGRVVSDPRAVAGQ